MNRRILTLVVALVPIVVFGVLAAAVRVPYVALGPGPTFDTLGEVDGKEVVAIEGTATKPTSGHLNMTTVSQVDGITLGQAIALWASGSNQLLPRDLVFPPEKSREDIEKTQAADFHSSEDNAKFAALNYLQYPKAVTVEKVNDPGPSVSKLEVGDAIDAVDGVKVAAVEQFSKLLKSTKPDQEIVVDFRRKNAAPGTARIKLGKNEDRDYGYLGIAVLDAPWVPFTIDFNLANIGGPSAGMIFSLAVIDKLTTGDLNGGKFIAGTGSIGADGRVGPIGGITHKMASAQEAGAEVFLVPADNCDEARTVHGDTMQLVKVETLPQAVDALKALSSGGKPPLC
ncbi:MAG: PDZ domain-containing protein [Mycobacterium sp.]|nr:PDZ domain-containing protein [Mycobacterium sp.]